VSSETWQAILVDGPEDGRRMVVQRDAANIEMFTSQGIALYVAYEIEENVDEPLTVCMYRFARYSG